jgi:hypothetical protein
MSVANQQMSPEEAAVYERVYVPAFVKRCAANGVMIEDQETLCDALETTAMVVESQQQKQGNVIKQAKQSLKQALGVDIQEQAEAQADDIRKEAAELGKDPEARSALLVSLNRIARAHDN